MSAVTSTTQHKHANGAPYADAATWLQNKILDYQKEHHVFLMNQKAIAQLFGVAHTQVAGWISGTQRPLRKTCLHIAQTLNVDPQEVLKQFHYPTLSDQTGATIPELITLVASNPNNWPAERVQRVIAELRAAEDADPDIAEVVTQLLRKNWPLMTRAERIGQWMRAMEEDAAQASSQLAS